MMRSWTESGIGFDIFTGSNYMDVVSFFENHKESYKEMVSEAVFQEVFSSLHRLKKDAVDEDGELDDEGLMDGLDDMFDFNVGSAIALIINYENGTSGFEGFPACGETDVEEAILYVPSYPWQLTEKEKTVTSEDIYSICEKYCKELNIPVDTIGDKELEYFG